MRCGSTRQEIFDNAEEEDIREAIKQCLEDGDRQLGEDDPVRKAIVKARGRRQLSALENCRSKVVELSYLLEDLQNYLTEKKYEGVVGNFAEHLEALEEQIEQAIDDVEEAKF